MTDEQWRLELKDAILSAETSLSRSHMVVHMRWTKKFYDEVMASQRVYKAAPSGSNGVMRLTKEHLEALKKAVDRQGHSYDYLPQDFEKTVQDSKIAISVIEQAFGASSADYITLYPTIG